MSHSFAAALRAAIAAALLASPALIAPASAQVAPPAERFQETFIGGGGYQFGGLRGAPSTQSYGGGRLVVGLAIGGDRAPESTAPADLEALRVLIPAASKPGRLCVTVTSADGRYSAESEHLLPADAVGVAALGLTSAYANEIAEYKAADLLVRARRADECRADAAGVHAPAALTAGDHLVVRVNVGRGRPQAQLLKDGAPVGPAAKCARLAGAAAATHRCAAPISAARSGVYKLQVTVVAFGDVLVSEVLDVALP